MKVEPKVLAAPTPVEPATLHQLMWCVLFCWETALLRPFRPPLMADTTTLAAVGDTVFAPSVLGPLKGVSGMRAPSVSGDVGGFPPAPPPADRARRHPPFDRPEARGLQRAAVA